MRKLTIFSLVILGVSCLIFNLLPFLQGRWLPSGEYWQPISFFTDRLLENFSMTCIILFGVFFMVLVYSLTAGKIVSKRIKMWGLLILFLILLLFIQTVTVFNVWPGVQTEGKGMFLIFDVIPYFLISAAVSFIVAILSSMVAENKLATRAFPIALIASLSFIVLSLTEWFVRKLGGTFVDRTIVAISISLIIVFPVFFLGTMLVKFIVLRIRKHTIAKFN